MTEHTEHLHIRRARRQMRLRIGIGVVLFLLCVFFAVKLVNTPKPMPIVYEKGNALMVKTAGEKAPFAVSQNYSGGTAVLTKDGKGIFFTDADNMLCYSEIKNAKSAEQCSVLADNVSDFIVPDERHIYYIKDGVLLCNNRKAEEEIAQKVTEYAASKDGRFLFYNTDTDLFGLDIASETPPVRIAEGASVYDILRCDDSWSIDDKSLYYLTGGKLSKLDAALNSQVLCEEVRIGFVLGESLFAITEKQIGEDAFTASLVQLGEPTKTLATEILGTEAVSLHYTDKTYMLFTKASDKKEEAEAFYTLDAKGNFRYLCENDDYASLFTDADGKRVYTQTAGGDLIAYKLSGDAAIKTNSMQKLAENVESVFAGNRFVGIADAFSFSICQNGKLTQLYKDGEPHYPKIRSVGAYVYVCDQAGRGGFVRCKNGKVQIVDDAVMDFTVFPNGQIAYLKGNGAKAETADLYMLDKKGKPVFIDSEITALR